MMKKFYFALNVIKINFKKIFKHSFYAGSIVFGVTTTLLSFFSLEEIGINQTCLKILIIVGLCISSFLISFIITLLTRSKTFRNGNVTLNTYYGDLFKVKAKERIIVIPVNDTFETKVESSKENNPLVSPTSIHGQWLNKILENDTNDTLKKQLDEEIKKSLKDFKYSYETLTKEKGKCDSYELGSIAKIYREDGQYKTTYYLLNISKFDENNTAHSNIMNIAYCINKLLKFYNSQGNNTSIYMPLIGSGNSKTSLSEQQSLDLLKTLILINDEKINGELNIVVYKGNKGEVSIL